MFEIRKEIVNSIGNVQRSEQIGFVDCTKEDIVNRLAKTYYNLAKANTLYYKLRGQSYIVRYVFIYKAVANIETVIKLANAEVKLNVDCANEYIKTANAAYKESNHKRGLKDKSMVLKPVDIKDFMWADKAGVVEDGYIIVVEGSVY